MKLGQNRETLNERGEGICSVPMWVGMGVPAGFCDNKAYGKHKGGKYYINQRTGQREYYDGSYNGYVPALACPIHGGPTKEEAVNLCDNCTKCIADCDGDPKFGIGKGNDNVFECNGFTVKTVCQVCGGEKEAGQFCDNCDGRKMD